MFHSVARTRRRHGRPDRHHDLADDRLTQTDPPTPDAATQPGGHFSQVWSYDAAGNELTHTDRRGIVTATTYDSENRPLTVTRDSLTTSTRTYDADGHVETDTDALGRLTTTVYDEAGRIVRITHTAAGSEIAHEAYGYDANGNRT